MVLNGGGPVAAAAPATFFACLNCHRNVTLEELRHLRRKARDRRIAADFENARRKNRVLIAVSRGGTSAA